MTIAHARYLLAARPGSEIGDRQGALVRIDTADGPGFADLHPWPELGDEPLGTELERLARGEPAALGRRSLQIAARDARARRLGRSLLDGLRVPPSHLLAPSLRALDERFLAAAMQRGFRRLKVKLGDDAARDTERLLAVLAFLPAGVRLRIDGRGRLAPAELTRFLAACGDRLDRIDYLEDPCPDAGSWRDARGPYRVDVARDRIGGAGAAADDATAGAEVLVVKPARDEVESLTEGSVPERLVVTSCLDHPLGQVWAAIAAAELARRFPGRVDVCGLNSHLVYEDNPFSLRLGRGVDFVAPGGTGLGFDDLLEGLAWTRSS